MALYEVTAIALDAITGSVVSGPRAERIDTATNELFTTCTHEWEVEETSEAFWNRLDAHWESDFPIGQAKVKVLTVRRIQNSQATRP